MIPRQDMPKILEIIKMVKNLGLETCMTLGMLSQKQARKFQQSGLDFYNHNLDTSPAYYEKIISTDDIFGRKFDINVDENVLDLIDNTNKILTTNGIHN